MAVIEPRGAGGAPRVEAPAPAADHARRSAAAAPSSMAVPLPRLVAPHAGAARDMSSSARGSRRGGTAGPRPRRRPRRGDRSRRAGGVAAGEARQARRSRRCRPDRTEKGVSSARGQPFGNRRRGAVRVAVNGPANGRRRPSAGRRRGPRPAIGSSSIATPRRRLGMLCRVRPDRADQRSVAVPIRGSGGLVQDIGRTITPMRPWSSSPSRGNRGSEGRYCPSRSSRPRPAADRSSTGGKEQAAPGVPPSAVPTVKASRSPPACSASPSTQVKVG